MKTQKPPPIIDAATIAALKEVDAVAPAAPLPPRCDDPTCAACAGEPGTVPHVGPPREPTPREQREDEKLERRRMRLDADEKP